ncbi:PRC-barrel domain-containing protein [Phycisphaerales bacterium AB-hyl4]|uniref:PRC-barrel domain-containing protein n=1 Tax=Natronomicrosphaera hydrolytica TaxID=3242702 RepID=A0ABV4U893_9BACT
MTIAAALMFGTGGIALAENDQAHDRDADDRLAPQQEQTTGDRNADEMQDPQQARDRDRDRDGDRMMDRDDESGVLLRGTEVTDYEIHNQAGERIGDISDLAVDTQQGKIAYVIVRLDEAVSEDEGAADGALATIGIGREHYALPWQSFEAVAGEEALTLTIDRERLAQMEAFDDDWDRLNDPGHARQQRESLGLDRDREEDDATSVRVEALSDLRGRDVQGRDDDTIAQIDDLMIDSREGHLAYAVLNYGGFLGIGRDYVAVPYQALQQAVGTDDEMFTDDDAFVLDADEDTLDRISFDRGDWPNMTDEQWAQSVHEAFDHEPYWQVFGYAPPRESQKDRVDD